MPRLYWAVDSDALASSMVELLVQMAKSKSDQDDSDSNADSSSDSDSESDDTKETRRGKGRKRNRKRNSRSKSKNDTFATLRRFLDMAASDTSKMDPKGLKEWHRIASQMGDSLFPLGEKVVDREGLSDVGYHTIAFWLECLMHVSEKNTHSVAIKLIDSMTAGDYTNLLKIMRYTMLIIVRLSISKKNADLSEKFANYIDKTSNEPLWPELGGYIKTVLTYFATYLRRLMCYKKYDVADPSKSKLSEGLGLAKKALNGIFQEVCQKKYGFGKFFNACKIADGNISDGQVHAAVLSLIRCSNTGKSIETVTGLKFSSCGEEITKDEQAVKIGAMNMLNPSKDQAKQIRSSSKRGSDRRDRRRSSRDEDSDSDSGSESDSDRGGRRSKKRHPKKGDSRRGRRSGRSGRGGKNHAFTVNLRN